ncbi:MAG: hypothetical protein IJS01_02385 [Lentisphaeria bacterium]|nr:hypothetical protein [Lentisphaeria bacterium]
MTTTKMKTLRRFEPDMERFPAVVIESDDWGAAEVVPREDLCGAVSQLTSGGPVFCKLESPSELQALYSVLEKHRGKDGLPPVFTAFTCVANPDFGRIRANGFTRYEDMAIDEGFPPGWDGRGLIEAYRDGMKRGVWFPEYHANLHHTSPALWFRLLKEESPAGENARKLFDMNCYCQVTHLPEYTGYAPDEMRRIIETGFGRFERIFGYRPHAAVTSDAFPETVKMWAQAGARAACLVNFRTNDGEIVYYSNKLWNFQDPGARCGDIDAEKDIVYLARNVWFDLAGPSYLTGASAETAFEAVQNNHRIWHDPAVVQMHRVNFSAYPASSAAPRLAELDKFLGMLESRGVYYLTTGELADLYYRGWSKREVPGGTLIRKWSVCDIFSAEATDLDNGKTVELEPKITGNFLLHQQKGAAYETIGSSL